MGYRLSGGGALPGALITPVPRLAQNKLAGIGVVAYIQPVQGLLESRRPGNGETCRPRVHTGDQNNVDDAIRLLCEIPGRSTPLQTPEEVQSVGDDQSFVQADLRLGERLSHALMEEIQLLGWLIHFNSRPWLCRGSNFGSRMLVVGLWLRAEEVEQVVAERLKTPGDLAG